jgi:ribA/ribD-fused uncharacterized protein
MKIINKFTGEYDFLSNFFYAVVYLDDMACPTNEHAYQAAKTLDPILRKRVIDSKSPAIAKKLGGKFLTRSDWREINLPLMENLVIQKFSYPELKEKLLATDDAILIEGNTWHDNFWGDCVCDECIHIKGKNHLGLIEMKVRDMLS